MRNLIGIFFKLLPPPLPDTCAEKFLLVSMGGWGVGLACADPRARTPIGARENLNCYYTIYEPLTYIYIISSLAIHLIMMFIVNGVWTYWPDCMIYCFAIEVQELPIHFEKPLAIQSWCIMEHNVYNLSQFHKHQINFDFLKLPSPHRYPNCIDFKFYP